MKTKLGLLGAAAALALTLSPQAMAGEGWYISVAGGGVWIDDIDYTGVRNPDSSPTDVVLAGPFVVDPGWAALVATGYGMGGWRVEVEGGYRSNTIDSASDIELNEWTAMMNVL